MAVITKDGLDALTLRTLATKAGVSSGAPYHHFADRADLLAAIARAGEELLGQALVDARDAAAPDPSARLAAMGQAYVTFALTHAGHFRVMFRGEVKAVPAEGLSANSEGTMELLLEIIQDCQRAGKAPPGDPRPLVMTAWSVVHGMATLWLDGSLPRVQLDPTTLVPTVTHLIGQMFAALGASAQPASAQ